MKKRTKRHKGGEGLRVVDAMAITCRVPCSAAVHTGKKTIDEAIESQLRKDYFEAFETLLDLAKLDLRQNKQLRGRLTPENLSSVSIRVHPRSSVVLFSYTGETATTLNGTQSPQAQAGHSPLSPPPRDILNRNGNNDLFLSHIMFLTLFGILASRKFDHIQMVPAAFLTRPARRGVVRRSQTRRYNPRSTISVTIAALVKIPT